MNFSMITFKNLQEFTEQSTTLSINKICEIVSPVFDKTLGFLKNFPKVFLVREDLISEGMMIFFLEF